VCFAPRLPATQSANTAGAAAEPPFCQRTSGLAWGRSRPEERLTPNVDSRRRAFQERGQFIGVFTNRRTERIQSSCGYPTNRDGQCNRSVDSLAGPHRCSNAGRTLQLFLDARRVAPRENRLDLLPKRRHGLWRYRGKLRKVEVV